MRETTTDADIRHIQTIRANIERQGETDEMRALAEQLAQAAETLQSDFAVDETEPPNAWLWVSQEHAYTDLMRLRTALDAARKAGLITY